MSLQTVTIGSDQATGQATGVTETHTFDLLSPALTVEIQTDGNITFTGDIFKTPLNYTTTGTMLNGILVNGEKIMGRNMRQVLPPGHYTIKAANASGGNRLWMITFHLAGDL